MAAMPLTDRHAPVWMWSIRALIVAVALATFIMVGFVIGRITVVSHAVRATPPTAVTSVPQVQQFRELQGYSHLPKGFDGP